MAAAGGEGLARTPLLLAGAALALLGVLVYLGALCAACRRYVLPATPCFPSWRWGPRGGIWWLQVENPPVPVLSWDLRDLLLGSPRSPGCSPSATLPGLILPPCASLPPHRTPCAQRSGSQLGMGDVAWQEEPRGMGDARGGAGGAQHGSAGCRMPLSPRPARTLLRGW